MADNLNLGQLTKEMIVAQLREAKDAPAFAADIVKQTILASIPSIKASGRQPKDSIEEICFGAISGLLLIEKNLPRAAVLILGKMAEISQKVGIDPSELMTWAMEGIARIAPMTTIQILEDTRTLIEHEYMGAGGIFYSLCQKYQAENK